MDWIEGEVSTSAATGAERGGFAHVNPYTIGGNLLVGVNRFVGPPFGRVWRQPVREDWVSRPKVADVEAPVGIHQNDPRSSPLSNGG